MKQRKIKDIIDLYFHSDEINKINAIIGQGYEIACIYPDVSGGYDCDARTNISASLVLYED